MLLRKSLFSNIVFAGNCFLVFLVAVESLIDIPAWLKVAGRIHPVVLHFPLVLIFLAIVWEGVSVFKKINVPWFNDAGDVFLLMSAVTAVFAAIAGFILSRETGYEGELVEWHKWSGVILSLWCFAWFVFRQKIRRSRPGFSFVAVFSLIVLTVTGHQGATITHGEDFILAPIQPEEELVVVPLSEARVYDHVVKPLLKSKCVSCHSSSKAKGELVLESPEAILKGGKNGPLWDTAKADLGLMIRSIHLPLEDKKHMPPKGKIQLSPGEVSILYHWIKSGASMTAMVTDLDPGDSLRILASSMFESGSEDKYDFVQADPGLVNTLNNHYRVVAPISAGSPALQVTFYSPSQFQSSQLEDLLKVKEQVVSLNLNKMPVDDEGLKTVAKLTSLRTLNLSFTDITDAGIKLLQSLKELRRLSLSGTGISGKALASVRALPSLTELYCWNTQIPDTLVRSLGKEQKSLLVETGFVPDSMEMQLPPVVIDQDRQIMPEPLSVQLKHVVNGVEIRYTTDGTDPDSLRSPLFKEGILVNRNMTIKARAFRKGWRSSELMEKQFLMSGIIPDSVSLKYAPEDPFRANGAWTVFDLVKGDLNFRGGKWIGFRDHEAEVRIVFKEPREIRSISVNTQLNPRDQVMAPSAIRVWGGLDPDRLEMLGNIRPEQPAGLDLRGEKLYTFSVKPGKYSVIKIIVMPLASLPSWHPGKGKQGWVLIDEITMN